MNAPLLALEQDPDEVLDGKALKPVANRVAGADDVPFDMRTTTCRRYHLPYYASASLLSFHDTQWPDERTQLCYLDTDAGVFSLPGVSPPIHEANAKTMLTFSGATVLDYLAFFCFFVRGDDGPFLIVDRPDGRFVPALEHSEKLEGVFREPSVWGQAANGDWRASALVYYADAVFIADFTIEPSGMVRMNDDTPVLADLGHRVHAPITLDDAGKTNGEAPN